MSGTSINPRALRPDGDSATIDLVVCPVEGGRREEAERVIDAYEHLRPDTAAVALGRGAIAALMGQLDEARARFNRAIERDPNTAPPGSRSSTSPKSATDMTRRLAAATKASGCRRGSAR